MHWNAQPYGKATVEREDITAPEFDNEATLRSARPVVPLAKIGSRSRARWISAWSAAFLLIALALGALIQFGQARLSPAQDSASDSANPLPTTETFANDTVSAAPSEGSANDTVPILPSNSSESRGERDQPLDPESKMKRGDASAPARRVKVQNRPEGAVDQASSQSLREVRRARRAAERMRRERVDRVDDIFKIEDIFGGSRTP